MGHGGLISIRDFNFHGELVRGANDCVREILTEQEEVFGEAVVDLQHVRNPIVDHVSDLQVRMEESSARLGGLIVEFHKSLHSVPRPEIVFVEMVAEILTK